MNMTTHDMISRDHVMSCLACHLAIQEHQMDPGASTPEPLVEPQPLCTIAEQPDNGHNAL